MPITTMLSFLSVVKASNNRFIDASASTVALWKNGQPIWIESLQRRFFWNSVSTDTNDNTTGGTVLQPTAVGGAGRAIWDGQSNNAWQTQLSWSIGGAGSNYENSGAPGSPISTGAEVSRRTQGQTWASGVYEIFILANLAAPDFLNLSGTRLRNSTIIVHGSATAGQAPAANVLYTSVAGMTARVAQARATNTRGTITDAAVPTGTWAGANLISNTATPNKRIRLTDGAAPDTVAWPQKSEAAGRVDVSQWLTPPPLTGPLTVLNPVEIAPAGTEHFVVELLNTIDLVVVSIVGIEDETVNTTGYGILFDSVFVPNISCRTPSPIMFWGCGGITLANSGLVNTLLGPVAFLCLGCHARGGSVRMGQLIIYIGCHLTNSATARQGGVVQMDGDTICQGAILLQVVGGVALVGSAAAFDSAAEGVGVRAASGLFFISSGVASYGFLLWGSGNANAGLRIFAGIQQTVPAAPSVPIITGALDFAIANSNMCIGRSLAGVATIPIATTWANLVAAQPAGFGGGAINELSSASISLEAF